MADYLPAFQAEWQDIISTVWPEIIMPGSGSVSNFFTAIQSLKTNITVRMTDDNPGLPYCFLAFGNFTPINLTSDRNDKNGPVTVFYIDSEANEATQTTINAKLQALDEAVRTRSNETFCMMADAVIDSSDLNPVMQTLRTQSGVTVCGGLITFPKLYVAAL